MSSTAFAGKENLAAALVLEVRVLPKLEVALARPGGGKNETPFPEVDRTTVGWCSLGIDFEPDREDTSDSAVLMEDALWGFRDRPSGDLAGGVEYPDDRPDIRPLGKGIDGASASAKVARIEADPRGGDADEVVDKELLLRVSFSQQQYLTSLTEPSTGYP